MSLDQQHWTVDPNDLHASNGMDLFEEFAPEPTAVRRANPTDSFTSMPCVPPRPAPMMMADRSQGWARSSPLPASKTGKHSCEAR